MKLNLSRPFFKMIGPGGRALLYPFQPPSFAIIHVAHDSVLGSLLFLDFSVCPCSLLLSFSRHFISCSSNTCSIGWLSLLLYFKRHSLVHFAYQRIGTLG